MAFHHNCYNLLATFFEDDILLLYLLIFFGYGEGSGTEISWWIKSVKLSWPAAGPDKDSPPVYLAYLELILITSGKYALHYTYSSLLYHRISLLSTPYGPSSAPYLSITLLSTQYACISLLSTPIYLQQPTYSIYLYQPTLNSISLYWSANYSIYLFYPNLYSISL